MLSLLSAYLSFWTRWYIRRTGVRIIAVTGSVGKTTTKEAIGAVVSSHLSARTVRGSFNTPVGVAMGILGRGWDQDYYVSGGGKAYWFRAAVAAPFLALFARPQEKYVVAEYGADHPGDIEWLASRFPPHIGVVTAIGDIPVHVEYYASPRELAHEKRKLVRHIAEGGWAVLNHDDLTVLEMREGLRAQVITFGLDDEARVRAAGLEILVDSGRPEGVTFSLHIDDVRTPALVHHALGRSQAYAAAAAAAVGTILEMTPGQIAEGLKRYRPPAGRMRLLRGIKDTVIIDDTYNSSPLAVHHALDTLKQVPATRRIAVLGDMLELGKESVVAHEAAGDMAGSIADVLVCVGERSKFTADAAANQIAREHIHWSRTAADAALIVQRLMRPGDVVLVKGSQGMRMERVTKEIMGEPERAHQRLVRQSPRWLRK